LGGKRSKLSISYQGDRLKIDRPQQSLPFQNLLLRILNHHIDQRRENDFHRKTHLATGYNQGRMAGHKGATDHTQEIGKINTIVFVKTAIRMDNHKAFIQ
jgi:hypothetical protein